MRTALYPVVISDACAVFLFFGISGFAAASRVRHQVIVNEIMAGTLSNQGMRIGRDDPERRLPGRHYCQNVYEPGGVFSLCEQ